MPRSFSYLCNIRRFRLSFTRMARRLFYIHLELPSYLLPEMFLFADTSGQGKARCKLHMLHANHFMQVDTPLPVPLATCFCFSSRDFSRILKYRYGTPLRQDSSLDQSRQGALAVRSSSLPRREAILLPSPSALYPLLLHIQTECTFTENSPVRDRPISRSQFISSADSRSFLRISVFTNLPHMSTILLSLACS
jgi:hypothetical protein